MAVLESIRLRCSALRIQSANPGITICTRLTASILAVSNRAQWQATLQVAVTKVMTASKSSSRHADGLTQPLLHHVPDPPIDADISVETEEQHYHCMYRAESPFNYRIRLATAESRSTQQDHSRSSDHGLAEQSPQRHTGPG